MPPRSARLRRRPPVGPGRSAGLAIGFCASLLAAGCQGNDLTPRRPLTTQAEPEERVPDQIIEEGTHIITREGVKKAVMTARRIFFYNVEGKVESDSVRVTFFDGNGVEQSWLTADHGEIDQRTNDMTARGKVLVVSKEGSRIQGDELRYDATRDLIVSEKPVTIFERNNKIQGKGVEADPGLTNIRMTGTSAVLESKPRVGGGRRGASAPAGGGGARPPATGVRADTSGRPRAPGVAADTSGGPRAPGVAADTTGGPQPGRRAARAPGDTAAGRAAALAPGAPPSADASTGLSKPPVETPPAAGAAAADSGG